MDDLGGLVDVTRPGVGPFEVAPVEANAKASAWLAGIEDGDVAWRLGGPCFAVVKAGDNYEHHWFVATDREWVVAVCAAMNAVYRAHPNLRHKEKT